ncbi:hypothetical protein [Streptomyces purpurascens]|uniref:hypothetical protein n=1 Tax=Streptomyces purpurascens TaxID=1924 RepID=UPI0016796840|nr:hypothetical protein [Streptomyces purpurascens]MCE7049527.1 hypothetical protein [Streptomyces purpurascens]GHA22338.1 hypothetical protein GCM10010303_36060 [Streptomyces purpurascens]
MGWSSANSIFNPVARALSEAGAPDDTKRKVLGDLIGGLQDGDWDTEDESLEDFLHDPAIVKAFADKDVHLADRRCCRAEHAGSPRAYLMTMRADGIDEDEMTGAIDAFAHHLAETIRQNAGLFARTDSERATVTAAANYIDPKVP